MTGIREILAREYRVKGVDGNEREYRETLTVYSVWGQKYTAYTLNSDSEAIGDMLAEALKKWRRVEFETGVYSHTSNDRIQMNVLDMMTQRMSGLFTYEFVDGPNGNYSILYKMRDAIKSGYCAS